MQQGKLPCATAHLAVLMFLRICACHPPIFAADLPCHMRRRPVPACNRCLRVLRSLLGAHLPGMRCWFHSGM